MTQVELNSGVRWMVGFVDTKLAVVGDVLAIGGDRWRVTRVYSTEPRDHVAWWFKATRANERG